MAGAGSSFKTFKARRNAFNKVWIHIGLTNLALANNDVDDAQSHITSAQKYALLAGDEVCAYTLRVIKNVSSDVSRALNS